MGTRYYLTDAPAIRIWNTAQTVVERQIVFDKAVNQYRFTQRPEWVKTMDLGAEEFVSVSGKARESVRGFRLVAELTFTVAPAGSMPTSVETPPRDGFTEVDLRALQRAILAKKRVEFCPHASMLVSGTDDRFEALVTIGPATNPVAQRWTEMSLAVRGVNVNSSIPDEF